ncbi:ATP-binding protein [Hoyosella subflava]|uniref:Putative anti-sigma regulatory factor, serine/threonine protein kinase n=1 Tax=Hoyosella subflava (strain DSM 45089 / JCM 17490 / NBRC 109087 / DQS3-9A1) TaxID=443218 RepID=F6EET4_HOYSD|nr:ATP-binding protein [Hoyosella subflava]AEF40884.1 Putative anti-sigma regulatory factor, serine/threonine protein kinase [Hoyosella subflava DQS3-9A1]
MHSDDGALTLTATAHPEAIDAVHELLAQLWEGTLSADDIHRMRFETAVAEVAGNIVTHGRESGTRTFTLTVGITDGLLEARFKDDGTPQHLDLTSVSLPEDLAESGRGLAIASALLDELHYRRAPGENTWYLALRV